MKGKYEEPIFYTPAVVQRSPSPPTHHVSALIRNMLTHRLARTSTPFSFSLPLPLQILLSLFLPLSSVARSLSPSLSLSLLLLLLLRLPQPSPSFWRVGSSEVVAVCIAKGNVSSTHTEKWVRTLERSLHMLSDTQCWGYVHRVNQITVSSAIRECSYFSLLSSLINY